MINFAVAGSLNCKEKIDFLCENGYCPKLVIETE